MKIRKFRKIIAIITLVSFFNSFISPLSVMALTSGPNQPEFSSFEAATTTNMVNEFTGDFMYNLPLLEVPGLGGNGYPITLSYHSGGTPEEDASWVGYGFTLNAGAITRNTRGFPDDYNGQNIRYLNRTPKVLTATIGLGVTGEIASCDGCLGAGFNAALRYNNYTGFGYNMGLGLSLGKGVISLGYNLDNNESSYSLTVNPAAIMNFMKDEESDKPKSAKTKSARLAENTMNKAIGTMGMNLIGGDYGIFTYSEAVRPVQVSRYSSESWNFSVGVTGNPAPFPAGAGLSVYGSYTYQQNIPEEELPAYGYMYASEADEPNNMKDFYIEKETPYNKRDVFLGVPFNNADNFMVSGSGIGGGFRIFHKNFGEFSPNEQSSETVIYNKGGDVDIGPDFGAGVDVGEGKYYLEQSSWYNSPFKFSSVEDYRDDAVFFRFNNDLGGAIDHPSGDAPVKAYISGGGGPGNKSFSPIVTSIGNSYFSEDERCGRSSYIGYSTNREILDKEAKVSTKNTEFTQTPDRTVAPDGIGEFVIYNQNAYKYTYGLPVYSRNEINKQFGVQGVGNIQENYLAYPASGFHYKSEVGEERPDPYAATFLLTKITSPDYIDRKNDGPTKDDFGAYTKFNYEKEYGYSKSDFYKWRIPYTGLAYQRNSLSDPLDDVGVVSEGEKEIYYLQSIETNNYVAIFETSDREDGTDAGLNAANDENAQGEATLKKLDCIKLYTSNSFEQNSDGTLIKPLNLKPGVKPVKTVRFKYNYSLCNGVPNSSSGKLTLEKVWFEYNGIEEAKISPYIFEYFYPLNNPDRSTDPVVYPARYYPAAHQGIGKGFDNYSQDNQNPDYNYFCMDAWGNYQQNGQDRYLIMQSWLDQTKDDNYNDPSSDFDPAAWQLKVIKLPSGGEIHIQYEQDDYAYVQDQPAHAMASVSGGEYNGNTFLIDPADIGASVEDIDYLVAQIDKRYKNTDKKIFFRFLYNLQGSGTPQIEDCNSEYITGYASVQDVRRNGDLIELELNDNGKFTKPCQICEDFYNTQRYGNLVGGNCDPSIRGVPDGGYENVVNKLKGFIGKLSVNNICTSMNHTLSYFRIPVAGKKKGGGLRVKRLLMYDKGLEDNQPVLYGNEYIYKTYDRETERWISSGVATSEPSAIKEENILTDFIKRKGQSTFSKIVAGQDRKQMEGPLGGTVYPGPSVGYSSVLIKNIHSGKTNPGFSVKEFYTDKDFPVEVTYTDMEQKNDFYKQNALLLINLTNNIWLSQGFSLKFYGMHGQIKREGSYSGDYSEIFSGTDGIIKGSLVSETKFEYFDFRTEKGIPVISNFGEGVKYIPAGKETDITMANKAVRNYGTDANIEGDVTVGWVGIFPIPYILGIPFCSTTDMEIYTHATSKVIRYPAITKKITAYQDGIISTTEYKAFDRYTGRPVSVKTHDEFNGTYLSQEIPASWKYPNLQPKYFNQDMVITGFDYAGEEGKEYLEYTGSGLACGVFDNFVKGDLLDLGNGQIYHVQDFDLLNNRIQIVKSYLSTNTDPPVSVEKIKIIESGRTNNLDASAGNIVFYSQNNDIPLPQVDETERWDETNNFADDLNAQIASGQTQFTLSGPYTGINMGVFEPEIPADFACDIHHASIKDVEFYVNNEDNIIDLKIMSFSISNSDETQWLTIEGDKPE